MRKFLTIAEATQEPFLFISYSHDDQETVSAWADYLFNQGVRVWWDKAFMGGDDWESIAIELLSHENCTGILFFCSQSAIGSKNAAKEWRTAAKTKEKRENDSFYPQIIMLSQDPSFDYKYVTGFVKRTEELFSDEDYDDFRSLFGKKDHLFFSANQEGQQEALLQTIKHRVPQAVDVHEIARDKLADISNLDKDVVLKLGTQESNGKPLVWLQIAQTKKTATLLCQDILTEEFGGVQATHWLEGFLRAAFSAEEQAALQGNFRLLTPEEAAGIPQEKLAAGNLWWLDSCNGNLQAVVREDGTIYQHGYNNRLYKKGIRPVITMDITKLYELVKN